MKKKFRVELFYEAEYPEIEAETEEEAFQQALKKWAECLPNVIIRPAEEEDGEDITCDACPYYYKDEYEDAPRCHCESSDGSAPCEIDDYEYEKEEEEYPELVFDPEEERR